MKNNNEEKEKYIEVPMFFSDADINKLIYLIYIRMDKIENDLQELIKLAKEGDNVVQ